MQVYAKLYLYCSQVDMKTPHSQKENVVHVTKSPKRDNKNNCAKEYAKKSQMRLSTKFHLLTREGFLRKKKQSCSFIFKNCAIHPYSQYIFFPLNEIKFKLCTKH